MWAEGGANFIKSLDADLEAAGNELGLETIGFSGDAYFAVSRQTVMQKVEDVDFDVASSRVVMTARAALAETELPKDFKPAVHAGNANGSLIWTLTGTSRITSAHFGRPMVEAYLSARKQ